MEVKTLQDAAAIREKGEAASQEEIDALRYSERAAAAPAVYVHPDAVPLSAPAVDLTESRMVAALQDLVILGEQAAALLAELQSGKA